MLTSVDIQLLNALTPREWELLLLLAEEHRNSEIAEKLFCLKGALRLIKTGSGLNSIYRALATWHGLPV